MAAEGAPLAGLAVAVTRPVRQNDALLQGFRVAGAEARAIPLLAIEPLQDATQRERIDRALQTLPDCQFVIFISQNAAEQTLLALQQRGMHWPATVPAYAVGQATAAYLTGQGIAASSPARMDSEGLLAMPGLQAVAGQQCLIFRGEGGRETLANTLRERGAMVDYCELYRRHLPQDAAIHWTAWLDWLQNRPALVCINSTETLRHLLAVDADATSRDNLTLLVPGERVARAAADSGFTRLCTANDATDSTTLDTAIHWYRS